MTGLGTSPPATIVCFGEVLLRLAAPSPDVLFQSMSLVPSFCGAEANVAVNLAGFGHQCRLVTALPDNSVGEAARRAITQFGVDVTDSATGAGRMGLYYLETGAMARPSRIIYDRAGSAFALSDPTDYDWVTLLKESQWLFVSGITAALGGGPLAALRAAIAAARAAGMSIAFDTNYRPTLWRGREREAAAILLELSCEADLLFAGRRAVAMMTGGEYGQADPAEGFHAAARTMFDLAPRLRFMAATRREIRSSDNQGITCLLSGRDNLFLSRPIELDRIVDRVGTGDAFAAGVLHGLVTGRSPKQTVEFAASCAHWAHSISGDFLRASVADLESIGNGSGDVRR